MSLKTNNFFDFELSSSRYTYDICTFQWIRTDKNGNNFFINTDIVNKSIIDKIYEYSLLEYRTEEQFKLIDDVLQNLTENQKVNEFF